jgi:hypothetical protein
MAVPAWRDDVRAGWRAFREKLPGLLASVHRIRTVPRETTFSPLAGRALNPYPSVPTEVRTGGLHGPRVAAPLAR